MSWVSNSQCKFLTISPIDRWCLMSDECSMLKYFHTWTDDIFTSRFLLAQLVQSIQWYFYNEKIFLYRKLAVSLCSQFTIRAMNGMNQFSLHRRYQRKCFSYWIDASIKGINTMTWFFWWIVNIKINVEFHNETDVKWNVGNVIYAT